MPFRREETPIILPSFPGYLEHVLRRPSSSEAEHNIRDLRTRHAGFGLQQSQMITILRISQDFKLLPFRDLGLTGGLKEDEGKRGGIILAGEYLRELATLIYFCFDDIAYTSERNKKISLEALQPKVEATIGKLDTSLGQYPDLMEMYSLGESIYPPTGPENPGKEIDLSGRRFNPAEVIKNTRRRF